jgi:hypothetical protein
MPELPKAGTAMPVWDFPRSEFEEPMHFSPVIAPSPTQERHAEFFEPYRAPKVRKPKYGGDKVALNLAAEMQKLEMKVQELRGKAEEAEEQAMKWDKIRSECSQNNQSKSCEFARRQYDKALSEARNYRENMEDPEEQIAIRRDILAQFKDEGDLSEVDIPPE